MFIDAVTRRPALRQEGHVYRCRDAASPPSVGGHV